MTECFSAFKITAVAINWQFAVAHSERNYFHAYPGKPLKNPL